MFYKLKVTSISHPIKEATTITLALPADLREAFKYHPGQHLVIKCLVDGQELRRSYSLNSSPYSEEAMQITVKRVKGGVVSNYVGDHLKVGDELDVMTPQGRFYADIDEKAYKTYFLFAAGSGITPIISILKSVLIASPNSIVNLFYGNANQKTIIFKNELDELQNQYPKRLQVVHTLSNPKLWSSWQQWKGRKGRIDADAVEWFITNHPPIAQTTEYYICGPGAMNISVRDTLIALGVPKARVHIEQFGGNIDVLNSDIQAVDNAELTVSIDGGNHQLTVPKGKTILQVLKDAGTNPPYSCESGVCGTCVAQITDGEVQMKSCMALEDEEIKRGSVLTCQSYPTSAKVTLTYNPH